MLSKKEIECIERARQAKLDAAMTRLAELRKNGVPFDNPLEGFTGKIEWKEDIGQRIIQIAFLPIGLILVILLFLTIPFGYMLTIWEAREKKSELMREIKVLEMEPLSSVVPDDKNLESLWMIHGLDELNYSSDERLNLLSTWIDILYGTAVTKNLRLGARLDESRRRQFYANRSYYEGKDAPHFHFASPVDSLVRELSAELRIKYIHCD